MRPWIDGWMGTLVAPAVGELCGGGRTPACVSVSTRSGVLVVPPGRLLIDQRVVDAVPDVFEPQQSALLLALRHDVEQ